jgi:hypothetical protein
MEQTQAAVPNDGTADQVPRLYNDVYFNRASLSVSFDTFPQFKRFPPELRLHVWGLFLARHRNITMSVAQPMGKLRLRSYETHNHLEKLTSGCDYAIVRLHPARAALFSPLLSVNSESRQATLEFYRVHLPAHFPNRYPLEDGKEGVLYLNPDYDLLDVDSLSVGST